MTRARLTAAIASGLRVLADRIAPLRHEEAGEPRELAAELRALRHDVHQDVSEIVLASLADEPRTHGRLNTLLMVMSALLAALGIVSASWAQALEDQQESLVAQEERGLDQVLLLGESMVTEETRESWEEILDEQLEILTDSRAEASSTQNRNRFLIPLSLATSTLGAALLGALLSNRLQTPQVLQGRLNVLRRMQVRLESRREELLAQDP